MTSPSPLDVAFSEICAMKAPLNERLAAYAAKLQELNLPFSQAYDSLVARLNEGEAGSASPKVGEQMPPFVLPEADGRLVKLVDLLERGPVVVSLNRGHWCPFCKMELYELARWRDEFIQLGTEVVSIMPDRQRYASTLRKGGLRVLSDIDNGYALSLGLVM